MKVFLAVRALFFAALLPGVVAGYLPYRMLRASGDLHVPALTLSSAAASFLSIVGVVVLLRCVWDFFTAGNGTLAPIDPPCVLVVRGLYRYTRNPMYNGVLAVLLGEAWLFGSAAIVEYALVVLVAFHAFVVLYEEPTLNARFPEAYRAYRRCVPRWGFTIHAYGEGTGSTA